MKFIKLCILNGGNFIVCKLDLSKVVIKFYNIGISRVVLEIFFYNWYFGFLSEFLRSILNDYFISGD